MKINTLDCLEPGNCALITDIISSNKDYLNSLGVDCNSIIKCLFRSPFNDPTAYLIKNVVIAIRNDDAKNIIIRSIDCEENLLF